MSYKQIFYGVFLITLLLHQAITSFQTVAVDSEINLPPTLEGNRALTVNDTGYVYYTFTPLTEKFFKEEALPQKDLLEIGSGFSNVTIEALKNRVGSYTANDISKEHLDILVSRVRQELGPDTETCTPEFKTYAC